MNQYDVTQDRPFRAMLVKLGAIDGAVGLQLNTMESYSFFLMPVKTRCSEKNQRYIAKGMKTLTYLLRNISCS